MRSIVILFACFIFKSVSAQNVTPLSVEFEDIYTGLSGPVGLYHCGDHRLFILEKDAGQIEIIDTLGNYIGQFIDVNNLTSSGGERGLLGMAFDPNYLSNGRFYINYTNSSGNTVIARYTVSANPNVANASSAEILLTITQPYGNHNGGHIAFGPDGYLYIGMGDGGSAGDPGNRAQDLTSRLGKMLRIDVSGTSGYAIPADNPFAEVDNAQPEIWASGLRNPWKFSFDRSTGDLWIADVGQNAWEEVNVVSSGSAGGENYGWRCYEGNATYQTSGCPGASELTFPVAVYSHSSPTSFCSITGGAVYRGSKYTAMQGKYFFTDYCDGKLYMLDGTIENGFTSTNLGDLQEAQSQLFRKTRQENCIS
ncbi:MAG: PQQ-dependent sugar dehydrogenase [Flavobacteriales bacterium]